MIAWTATPVADVTGRRAVARAPLGHRRHRATRQEEEIRASRARIIEAADDARRVLERNLHDGAQQRLVALSVSLRLAETRATRTRRPTQAIITRPARSWPRARGAARAGPRHPPRRADRPRASRPPSRRSSIRTPVPVTVTMPSERLPAPIEAAAYYVVVGGGHEHRQVRGRDDHRRDGRGGGRRGHRHRHRRRVRRRRSRCGHGPARAARPRRGARRDAPRRQPGRPGDADRGRDPARARDPSWPCDRCALVRGSLL